MFCSAMVLLTLLSSTTTSSQNPSSCKPAACSDLCITYPFWIGGTHPAECGYHTFQVKCVDGRAYLRPYQIFNISYEDNSFQVIDDRHSYDICDTELNINASSDLSLTPFGISATNQELFFLYNCIELRSQPPPPAWAPVNCLDGFTESTSNSFAWLAGGYRPDDKWSSLPGACRVSMMPVLGYKGTSRADYRRLMKCRSLFEYTGDDCKVCEESGGLCRINTTYDIFECHSSDRISPSTCGELHTHNSGSEFDLCKNDAPV